MARERKAETVERQRQILAELRRSALFGALFQLEPNAANRQRWQAFLALIAPRWISRLMAEGSPRRPNP